MAESEHLQHWQGAARLKEVSSAKAPPPAGPASAPAPGDLPLAKQVEYLGQGVIASDPPTRWGSQIFWLSLIGLLVSTAAYWTIRHEAQLERERALIPSEEELARRTADERQRAEIASLKERSLEMGQFSIQIVAVAPPHPGVLNTASVEITLECDHAEACERIKGRVVQARNEVIGVFRPVDREELFSKEGKKRLKRLILDRLNHWSASESGKVTQVHFVNLIVL